MAGKYSLADSAPMTTTTVTYIQCSPSICAEFRVNGPLREKSLLDDVVPGSRVLSLVGGHISARSPMVLWFPPTVQKDLVG